MKTLFETVLTMSLSAAFLVAMIIGLRWCFRKIPRWVNCALWALVAVRLLLPSLPESELSMVPEKVSDSQAVVEFVQELPQPGPVFREPAPTAAPEVSEVPSPAPEVPAKSFDWMELLSWVWISGAALMGLYGVWSWLRIRRKVAPSVHVGDRVYLCDYIDTPFLLGLFRPRIYLPSGLDSLAAGFVLAHERAHLRRRDHFWKPLGFVLLSFHWFNPMLWLGYILLCRDIEMACDEAVIRTMGQKEKQDYSQALLNCSVTRRMVSICPLAFGEVSVKERIRSVLRYKKPALWVSIIGLAAVILGAVFFLTNPVKQAEEPKFYPTAQYDTDNKILSVYEYDENMEGSAVTIYVDGVLSSHTEFLREKDGNKRTITQTSTQYSADSGEVTVIQTVIEQELDRNDHVLKEEKFRNGQLISTALYNYDRKGNLLSMDATYPGFSQRQEHTYDRHGNCLSNTFLMDTDGDGQMDQSQEERYTRDKEGRLLTSESYTDGVLSNRCQYTYDEENNMQTCEEVENRSGTLTTHIAYYSEYGNILCVENEKYNMYCNYIGEDGSRIIGIPEDIYTEPDRYISDFNQEAYDTVKAALTRLVEGNSYQVKTVFDGEKISRLNLKSGSDYMLFRTDHPFTGSMQKASVQYVRRGANWIFSNEEPEADLKEWYRQYVYSPEQLELWTDTTGGDGVRSITFIVSPETDQRDHKLTFRLDKDGNLLEMKESGIVKPRADNPNYSAYTTISTVITTDDKAVGKLFHSKSIPTCEMFDWDKELIVGKNNRTEGFQNTEPTNPESLLDVYRLAEKEFPYDYATAQVYHDRDNKMWRVAFRDSHGDMGSVYMDEEGVTKLVTFAASDILVENDTQQEDWENAPDTYDCIAVVSDVQGRDHWRIRTYFDNAPWSETTAWLRGADSMMLNRLPGENGDVMYGEMVQDGVYFKSGPQPLSGDYTPRWREETWPKDRERFFENPPWLISFNWELYDVQTVNRFHDSDGWGVHLKMTSQNRESCPEDYDVIFRFDDDKHFVKARVSVLDGNTLVSQFDTYIESTDWDEVSAQMDEELARAAK